MKNIKQKAKVIWAVDPFPKDKKTQIATFKVLAKLTEGTTPPETRFIGSETRLEPGRQILPERERKAVNQ